MPSISQRYAPEVRERAVRLVLEHQHVYASQRAEVDTGRRPGLTSDERTRLRELERENCEQRRANEMLKSASLFFATELDGRTRSSLKPLQRLPSTFIHLCGQRGPDRCRVVHDCVVRPIGG